MIKGGGGALTREKITAAVARKFVCICDGSKLVPVLGKFPVPIEVIPMARSYVAREIVKMGGHPQLRQGFTTDNGNVILDCHGMTLLDPPKTESSSTRSPASWRTASLRAGRRTPPWGSLRRRTLRRSTDWAAVFLLSLAAFASAASLRATDPLLPLIAEEYGVTAGAASAAVTAFALSYGLLQVVCGPLGDRYGRYRTIAAAAFVSAFGSAACAIALARHAGGRALRVGGDHRRVHPARARVDRRHRRLREAPAAARALPRRPDGRRAFGTAAAGWLGEHFGWRSIFFALSALLLHCALLLLEIRTNPSRPPRRGSRCDKPEHQAHAAAACSASCKCCLPPGTPKACSSSARSLSWRSICSGATASGPASPGRS